MSPNITVLLGFLVWLLIMIPIGVSDYRRKHDPNLRLCKKPTTSHTTCFGPGTRCM